MKSLAQLLTRYWGYLAAVVAMAGYFLHDLKLAVILAFSPAGGRAVLRTSKSVSGALSMIGGVVAGVQVLIAAGALAFH
jgi:hypothetical protein